MAEFGKKDALRLQLLRVLIHILTLADEECASRCCCPAALRTVLIVRM